MSELYEDLAIALAEEGFLARGGFHPKDDDGLPDLLGGGQAGSLVMVGNAGPGLWARFQAAPEASDGAEDPMNRWTERVLSALAERFGAAILFPFGGPPYYPFQRWAARAEPVVSSPLGILIHPRFGLWHAYRAALMFAERIELPAREEIASPCESCADRPCLSTCPVSAFDGERYDVPACVAHISGPAGQSCLNDGCLARHACPVGRDFLYPEGQAGFHMGHFLAAQQRGRI